ncbi:MAG: hypothetical protein ACOVPA_16055 [Rubrivivax sp.]
MRVSDQDVFNWLESNPVNDYATLSAMQEFGVSPEQIARVTGLDIGAVNDRIGGVVNNVYSSQFGRTAAEEEIANAMLYLQGGGMVDQGVRNLNNTQEGYNYDTQDIISAYREAFGKNPTQEEYVGAMATLGIENFDRSSLGQSGAYTAATVAALESDPYAGRFAGYNPYDLPEDAANVSTNILGDRVQYISPITQRPVVASFEDGKLSLTPGVDVLTPQQVQSAIGLATATGGLTPKQLLLMNEQLNDANTIDDVYAAFSAPQAVVSLGPGGKQTGVSPLITGGATGSQQTGGGTAYDDAVSRGFGGVDMDALYKTLYKDAAPYKFSDTITTDSLRTLPPTNKQDLLASTQLGAQQGLNLQSSLQDPTTFRNFGTFGAAGDERLGAGSADYQSDLIKSLREADNSLVSQNTGVTKYGFLGANTPTPTGGRPLNAGGALSPAVFSPDVASNQDVSDWNNYNTYRTNSLQAKTPYTSFEQWLAGGKVSGIPEPVAPQTWMYGANDGGGA